MPDWLSGSSKVGDVMSTSRSFESMYGWEPCIGWQYGQTLAVGA